LSGPPGGTDDPYPEIADLSHQVLPLKRAGSDPQHLRATFNSRKAEAYMRGGWNDPGRLIPHGSLRKALKVGSRDRA